MTYWGEKCIIRLKEGASKTAAIDEITQIIGSFKELSGVGICFYDLENFFRYDSAGAKENSGHYCELCNNVKLLRGGRTLCDISDRRDAVAMAHEYRTPFFTRCHIGMCELVVPIYRQNELKGIIFLGQCRIEKEDYSNDVSLAAQAIGGDGKKFKSLYEALPEVSRKNLLSMGKILQLYFANLAKTSDFFGASQNVDEAKKPLAQRIAAYIERSYMHPIASGEISRAFFLNQSYMEREFCREYGCTVTHYIMKIRLKNAARLLENTNAPIHSIALNVGFTDANYFSRAFKKFMGVSPTEYRK